MDWYVKQRDKLMNEIEILENELFQTKIIKDYSIYGFNYRAGYVKNLIDLINYKKQQLFDLNIEYRWFGHMGLESVTKNIFKPKNINKRLE